MSKADYYDLLGVAKSCTADDLKKAYRKLAMKFHPDKNPGDHAAEHKFKEISEAYQILSDGQTRAAYDRFGHAAFQQGGGPGFGGFDFAGSFADIFDEMFGEILGGGRRQAETPGTRRGGDLRYDLDLSLEEAFRGGEKTISIVHSVSCADCKGQGAAPGTAPVACTLCKGAGRVRAQQGFFTIERTCPQCQGAGRVIQNPCKKCGGQGRVRQERTLAVAIPPGVEDGTRIRLAGEGEAGLRGGNPGDLYVILGVATHPIFQRDGANLHCRVPIPMTTAALGGAIEVPTIDGDLAEVAIDPGIQTGHRVRVKQKGMSVLRSSARGDLYVEVAVETPSHLSKRQKELLEEFTAEAKIHRTHPESESFLAKVKEFLAR
ncbi:MAG TPA: molecular chaperone DnaJ [Alphaproteobacteria bacterium]|nr:molecular chaperone DnaJ [Alphaproteobacteria bacterium]